MCWLLILFVSDAALPAVVVCASCSGLFGFALRGAPLCCGKDAQLSLSPAAAVLPTQGIYCLAHLVADSEEAANAMCQLYNHRAAARLGLHQPLQVGGRCSSSLAAAA
jgi:hypothetical protein